MNPNLKNPVQQIIKLLVEKKYGEVVRITQGVRLDSLSIEEAICNYGRILTMPPNSSFEHLDVIPIKTSQLPQWSIRMNLWTIEEGQSDLSIELTIKVNKSDYVIELDDIHVL